MKNKHWVVYFASLLLGVLLLFVVIPSLGGDKSPVPGWREIYSKLNTGSEASGIPPAFLGTFIRFISAVLIGSLIGVFLGIVQTQSRLIKAVISPWLDVFRVTPTIVWISALYIIRPFGTLRFIPIMIGALFAALYVSLYVEQAISGISDDERAYISAQRLGDNFRWKLKYCYWPRILAAASTGLKVGGSIALILVIVAEALTGTPESVGSLLYGAQFAMNVGLLWAMVIGLSLMALICFTLFSRIEKLVGGRQQ